MKNLKKRISWVLTIVIVISLVLFSGVTTALASFGSMSIHQGTGSGNDVKVVENNITKYYPESGPLVVKISSIFTNIAADNAELVITNASNQRVFSDKGKQYFLSGSYSVYGLEKLPAGKYRAQLVWGTLDLGAGGYKDFTIVKGQHPAAGPSVAVTGVKLNRTSYTMNAGKRMQLTATVSPSNATNKSVTWKSSNTGILTVDKTGKVTSTGTGGKATITATTANGKTVKCTVTVKQPAKTMKMNRSSAKLTKGKTVQLKVGTFDPPCTYPKALTWKSGNTKVAKVDKNGKVTAVGKGTCIIYAKSWNGVAAKCKIVVS